MQDTRNVLCVYAWCVVSQVQNYSTTGSIAIIAASHCVSYDTTCSDRRTSSTSKQALIWVLLACVSVLDIDE